MVNRRNINARKRRAAGSFARQFFVGLLLTLVLLLIGGVIWFGSRLEPLTIASVSVEGGETVDRAEVKRAVEAELDGEYYKIVPKRFSWSYPEQRIEAAVRSIDRVKDVALARPDGRNLIVRFTEYAPAALWCEAGRRDDCVFLDSTGYGFTKAPPLQGTAMLRYVNAGEPAVGERPFSYEFMRDTGFFAAAVRKEFGMSVSMVEKIGGEEATFELAEGGLLKITLRQPVVDTLDNLRVLLASEQFSNLRPGSFQYIDLRFGDKMFVNQERDEPAAELTASTTAAIIE